MWYAAYGTIERKLFEGILSFSEVIHSLLSECIKALCLSSGVKEGPVELYSCSGVSKLYTEIKEAKCFLK